MKKLERVYHPYYNWEDFKNGMYDTNYSDEEVLIEKACSLLTDCELFFNTSKELLIYWPISSEVNLSNVSCNRCAWIGHASCSYLYGVPEILTRKAWGQMTGIERNYANAVAQKIIKSYETKNTGIYKGVGAKMLF